MRGTLLISREIKDRNNSAFASKIILLLLQHFKKVEHALERLWSNLNLSG